MSKMPNISDGDLQKISERSNFKYEEDYETYEAATLGARGRSMTTHKVIYLFKEEEGCYWVNSHGIAKAKQVLVARFQRGNKL